MERVKNGDIKEIMGVKWKPDTIDIIEQKRLQEYGDVKRMPEEIIPKLTFRLLMSTIVVVPHR